MGPPEMLAESMYNDNYITNFLTEHNGHANYLVNQEINNGDKSLPLWWAVDAGNLNNVEALLNAGADVNVGFLGADLPATTQREMINIPSESPLQHAIQLVKVDIVNGLLKHNAIIYNGDLDAAKKVAAEAAEAADAAQIVVLLQQAAQHG